MQEKVIKSYDLDTNPKNKRKYNIMNEYGYNFENNKNEFENYEKNCRRVLYSDVNNKVNKGKR